jgi:hypothetical protein
VVPVVVPVEVVVEVEVEVPVEVALPVEVGTQNPFTPPSQGLPSSQSWQPASSDTASGQSFTM